MVSFVKSVNSLVELTAGLADKNIKKMSGNIIKIAQLITDQNGLLDVIDKEVYSHI